jgi:hypothetical protein
MDSASPTSASGFPPSSLSIGSFLVTIFDHYYSNGNI